MSTAACIDKIYDELPDMKIALCGLGDVFDFVVKHHYSHSCPRGGIVSHAFSVRVGDELVGAAIFGHKAGGVKTASVFVPPYGGSEFSRELIRLVLVDAMPHNSESRFIGWCLRYLKSNSELLGLLSYADPEHDHSGTIYRASNWLYTGISSPSRKLIVDGEEIHRRRATNLFGTCSESAIQAMGHTVETRVAKPKHRYVYIFQQAMLPFVKYPILKFVALMLLMVITAALALSRATRVFQSIAKWFSAYR